MFKLNFHDSIIDVDTRKATQDSRLHLLFASGDCMDLCLRSDLSEGLWVSNDTYPPDLRAFIGHLSNHLHIFHGYFGARLGSPLEIGGRIELDMILTHNVAGWKKFRAVERGLPLHSDLEDARPFEIKTDQRLMPYAHHM